VQDWGLMVHNSIIVGGGGHGVSVYNLLGSHPDFEVVGFVDRSSNAELGSYGVPYLGTDEALPSLVKQYSTVFIGVGQIKSADLRVNIATNLIRLGASAPALISPFSRIGANVSIGRGSTIFHGTFVNAGAKIGEFNIINTGAIIEHGVTSEPYVHIAPRATLLGDVKIGAGCFVGAGAIIKEGVVIGQNCIIGAGEVVMKDVASNVLVRGGEQIAKNN